MTEKEKLAAIKSIYNNVTDLLSEEIGEFVSNIYDEEEMMKTATEIQVSVGKMINKM